MQTHKKQIEKRIYAVGETIKVPAVKRVAKGIYEDIVRKFKINSVDGNVLHGEYLN